MTKKSDLQITIEKSIKNYNFPFLDDAHKITGHICVQGFISNNKKALVFQQIAMTGSGNIVNNLYAYGDNMENGLVHTIFCINEDIFLCRPDSQSIQCRITDVVYNPSKDSYLQKIANVKDYFPVTVNDQSYDIPVKFPETKEIKFKQKKKVKYFSPAEWVFLQLCDTVPVKSWFVSETDLKKLTGFDPNGTILFSFNEWHHPDAITTDITPDIEVMLMALENQKIIQSLPGNPNTGFRYWLDSHINMRDGNDWAWGK